MVRKLKKLQDPKQKHEFDYVLPMDGDGEDRPEEIKQFVEKIKNSELPIVCNCGKSLISE